MDYYSGNRHLRDWYLSSGIGNRTAQPRRVSEERLESLQYRTERIAVPAHLVAQQVHQGPPPGQKTKSKYPQEYYNREGIASNSNIQPWEMRYADSLYEYPVKRASERPFDFNRRYHTAIQVQRSVHPNDRARDMLQPKNDAGIVRGIADQRQRVVGAVAHPLESKTGHQRAHLEPLDRQGRQELHRYQDRIYFSRMPTWPPR